ncbi:MAG: hypothetical protein HFI90_02425 [Clostridia bacterium]|nr:hypothetical protein [Clostridia bacterium]
MGRYEVKITETLSMDIEVEAESAAAAARKVEEAWENSKYVLTADDFKEVNFYAQEKELEE